MDSSITDSTDRGSSLASNAPLARVVAFYVNDGFLKEVAAEHMKGRRLLIGTTNLDAQRPVVWNVGPLAVNATDQAPDTLRRVIPASASIPGAFPPAEIDEAAWATLYRDTSRPFPRPTRGRIAVKVINHFGDEVMKVFRV